MGIVYRYLITICLTCLTLQYFHMPFKIKSCQQLRITIQFINYLTCEICSSSCYNSGFNLLTYILSHWLHNCWFAAITNQRDPLTGPPSHWPPSLWPPFNGPPTHWSPILYCNSLVPHLIGPQSRWSPISLVPLFISHPIIGQSQWPPISFVPHLIGSPSHWSPNSSSPPPLIGPPSSTHAPPIPLVPHLIGPPDSLVPHLIGPPSHWFPFHWSPKFISLPVHCLNTLVIFITGYPFH